MSSTVLNKSRERAGEVNKTSLTELVTLVLEVVEAEPGLKGLKAREVAIEVIISLIEENAGDDKEWLLSLAKSGLLESLIDTIISASKGIYDLNKEKIRRGMLGCFSLSADVIGC